MRKIIIMTILLALPLVCFGQETDQPLQLTIKSGKQVYEVGEGIIIDCELTNISDEVISFYKAYIPEMDFRVVCGESEMCPVADAPQTAGGTSLISLKPKEALRYSINGKIIEGRGRLHISGMKADAKFSEVSGIFLEHPYRGKVYLKNGFGKYEVTAYYSDGSSWALPPSSDYIVGNKVVYPPEVLEQFKDKWQGKLNSNTITIEVVKRKE